ncbi:MAG TPA: DUF5060 domain-containing protein [Chthonomonadaceae bacterium]|nr:DUF5060 domain-containing protein [Chthonomonadaceae bacterium]
MRKSKGLLGGLLAMLAFGGGLGTARAQAPQADAKATAATGAAEIQIAAESAPYRLEFRDGRGTFLRSAFGQETEKRLPLLFLHTDAGPAGYAKYLAWFLARDNDSYALLWCYLNDTGSEFWCWLYRFPSNQLTTLRFTGSYRFAPPAEPVAPAPMPGFKLTVVPRYLGADFLFGNWTRRSGDLERLDLFAASAPPREAAPGRAPTEAGPAGTPLKTLTRLRVAPLHELNVAAGNGWREGGWRELHALATDAAGEPYYLILYSNATRGYAIDLQRAVPYIADFGAKVQFTAATPAFGASEHPETELDLRIPRGDRHEFVLTSHRAYANPALEVTLTADFISPDSKPISVPGFWDGGATWRVRFVPQQVGRWSWHLRSNDPELDGQQGEFDCVAAETTPAGFLRVNPASSYRHHFARMDGTPFFPAMLHEPVHFIAKPGLPVNRPLTPVPSPQEQEEGSGQNGSASFQAFQQKVDACAALGINRFVGGFLIDPVAFARNTQVNEGGTPFVDGDLDRPNPAYFQWMDRRIAYCNEKGIVPDLGIGWPGEGFFAAYSMPKLRRMWRYVVARYAAYDVCWNLFGPEPLAAGTSAYVAAFARLTRQNDPYRHPLTTVTVGPQPVPTSAEDRSDSRLDVVTQWGGDLDTLAQNWSLDKPLVVLDPPGAKSGEGARQRLWETRMQGGYGTGAASAEALDSPEVRWTAACARFFRTTNFWRLRPHPELIDRGDGNLKRPHRPETAAKPLAASFQAETSPQAVPPPNAAPAARVFVLADPAWEYAVYFAQGGSVTLDLLEATGRLKSSWFNPRTGEFTAEETIQGGAYQTFTAPDGNDWVLHLSRR